MTDILKPKRGHGPIDPEDAVKKIRLLFATQQHRVDAARREIVADDVKAMQGYLLRVTSADHRETAREMLKVIGITVPVIDAEFEEAAEPDHVDDTPSRSMEDEYPELPRGATEYVPGAVALAARGKR